MKERECIQKKNSIHCIGLFCCCPMLLLFLLFVVFHYFIFPICFFILSNLRYFTLLWSYVCDCVLEIGNASMYSYNKYITYNFVCVCFLRMLLLRSGRDAYTNAHGSDRCQPSRYSWTWLKMPLSSVASGRYGKQMRMYKPATVLYKLSVYRISILFCI